MSDYNLYQADVISWLRGRQWLYENDFLPRYHGIISDPPYFLGSIVKRFGKDGSAPAKHGTDGAFQRQSKGFMGQQWDGFDSLESYQEWATEWGRLALSAVYPGAIGLFFGGTRTYHRLACGLENAGWEVVDCISYIYASGFPKAHDISKAIDKAAGAEREKVAKYQRPDGTDREYDDWTLSGNWKENSGFDPTERAITAPATPDAIRWNGYKTALKPAWEAVIVARAPRGKHTFADLALTYGTGAFNVDGGRIEGTWERSTPHRDDFRGDNFGRSEGKKIEWLPQENHALGRYPANVLFSHAESCTPANCADGCPIKALAAMSGESVSPNSYVRNADSENVSAYSKGIGEPAGKLSMNFGDSGTAARFFFGAKAASWEREAGLEGFDFNLGGGMSGTKDQTLLTGSGNIRSNQRRNPHPTVKPAQLTEYLARLILPPALDTPRRLLVPCAGVGSEMIGGLLAGWDVVDGIEREAQYTPIAEARLKWWSQFASYDKAKERWDSEHKGAVEEAKLERVGQLPMFRGELLHRPAGKTAS